MGVLRHQILVCGQIILFSLVMIDITDAEQTGVSSLKTTIAPPLNATGNYTVNDASNSSSNSTYNNSITVQSNLTTQVTITVSMNSTSGLNQTNATVTGSPEQPNATETVRTTQSSTSSAITTNSTAVTLPGNSTENATTSKTVTKTTAITTTDTQNATIPSNESQGGGLNHSEKSITVLFSILLGVIAVVVLGHFVYKIGRNKERSVQYTHRRLQNEDTGEPFPVPDDTLVISGGLYDGPQIYNPTMTVQNEEEFQTDALGFASRPSQFRLEFLREDEDRAFDPEISTYQTFRAHDQED